MDLNSRINSWWARGTTKRKTVQPTIEKVSLHGDPRPSIETRFQKKNKSAKNDDDHDMMTMTMMMMVEIAQKLTKNSPLKPFH